jgi:hypothetical protein
MNAMRSRAFGVLAIVGMGAACSVGELDYEGKTCPCPSGYGCDDETNTCTKRGSGNGGGSGDGSGGDISGGSSGESGDGSGGSAIGGSSGESTGGSGTGGGGVSGSGRGGAGGSGKGGGSGRGGGGAGSGGTSGAGGSAGSTGPFTCSGAEACGSLPNNGLNVVLVELEGDAYVDCSQNCIGLQGAVATHTNRDASVAVDVSSGNLCLSGVLRLDGSVEVDIGLGIYDTDLYGINGFEFTVDGNDVPAGIQFGYYYVASPAENRCIHLDPPRGQHAVPFDAVYQICGTDTQTLTDSFSQILDIAIYVLPNGTEETFDFCISGLAATR